ncbi:MAG TPA: hypothetical protein VEA69_12860 [Tepidisphaeraceae bacterium]|nr:hypothetical protein [Tepidisphaeraceae bacterium]
MRISILALFVATVGFGCASNDRGTLTVKGEEDTTRLYAQSFDHAFIRASAAGEYDIVMFQEGDAAKVAKSLGWGDAMRNTWAAVWPWAKKAGDKPIKPLGEAEFRQVVHIHVLWQAAGGSVARDGVVTNAQIDWYVIGHSSPGAPPEMLRYQGAGYVVLDEGRKNTTVNVRDGLMRKTEGTGELNDPIGPARLVGKISAQNNREAVDSVLAELKTQMTVAKPVVSLVK